MISTIVVKLLYMLYLKICMRIKDIPLENQPRQRLLRKGVSSLSNAELLAIILQKGTKDENVIDMSNRLLNKFNLAELSLSELQQIKGIGPAKAMQIVALFEFNKRYKKEKKLDSTITRARDVYQIMDFLKQKKKEHMYGLYLDTKNKIIEKPELLFIGILDASLIHPREILKHAVKKSAKSFIIVHNHPSGEIEPSEEDIDITERIKHGAELLDITLLDHVIIGNSFYSFKENDLI